MSGELFQEYRGIRSRDGVVAAAVIEKDKIKVLSQVTGGTAIAKKIRGGSMVLSEIILHGENGKVGDYIIADNRVFYIMKKDAFEALYSLRGPLRDNVV